MQPRAIETRYKGYRFRSRLEARWAVFFDHIGWAWTYEAEGYDLGHGMLYLPDFKVGGAFIEVKAARPTPDEQRKAWLLAQATGAPVAFGIGLPDPHVVAEGLPGFYKDLPFDQGLLECAASPSAYCFNGWGYVGVCMGGAQPDFKDFAACAAARAARFEHGESGARGGRS